MTLLAQVAASVGNVSIGNLPWKEVATALSTILLAIVTWMGVEARKWAQKIDLRIEDEKNAAAAAKLLSDAATAAHRESQAATQATMQAKLIELDSGLHAVAADVKELRERKQ